MKVLVVDDEKIKLVTLRDDLREANYDTIAVESPTIALQLLQHEHFDVLVTDLRMPKMHGLEFLKRVKKEYPHIAVLIMTAYASVETAVEAIKFGAHNYIQKPFSSDELIAMLDKLKVLRGKGKGQPIGEIQRPVDSSASALQMIGKSQPMQTVFELLETVADSSSNVLVYGEKGVGKALLAKLIHLNSSRAHQPYVNINCTGLSQDALEHELFGYEPRAFTDGDEGQIGRLKLAADGTLFIAAVNDLPLETQVKLLRVIEEGEFEPIGSKKTIKVDVRVIAATTTNLQAKVQKGEFREELFYRLNVIPLFLPALRERMEDIPLLVNHFLDRFSPNRPIRIAVEAVNLLMGYPWPGNVRELENVIERLVAVCGGRDITVENIPIELKLPPPVHLSDTLGESSFHEIIRETERELIAWAMQKTKGNKTQAAKLLKMRPSTFRDALAKHIDQIESEVSTTQP